MLNQEIPIAHLPLQLPAGNQYYSATILEDEISGIQVEHAALVGGNVTIDSFSHGSRTIYLFFKGSGTVMTTTQGYEIGPETVLVPNSVAEIVISAAEKEILHYLKITTELTPQDMDDLRDFPADNTQSVYYAKFVDCQPYTEPIKSPNTVSRTIFPNQIVPRVAMGTVQTKGPDEVGAHKHPMLDQLFLGLADNNCTVYADDAEIAFPQYSVLHVPLGSTHSVSVADGETMYYVWMDFFLDRQGEEWLKTHQVIDDA